MKLEDAGGVSAFLDQCLVFCRVGSKPHIYADLRISD